MNYNTKVNDYISGSTPNQIEILEQVRKFVHENIEGVSEEIKWGFPVFAKTKDFAYMRFSKKHITLGFYNTDKIKDPNNVLEGTGSTLKHIKIKDWSKVDKDLVRSWLKAIAV